MKMNAQQIRIHLDRIIQYLLPYEEFLNCHMVNYLCDKYWKKFIPELIRNSIKTESDIQNAINDIWWNRNKNTKFVQLLKFIEDNEKLYLENLNVLTSLDDIHFENEYNPKHNKIMNPISVKEFMNEKKRHEVEIMAKTVNLLIERYKKNSDKNFIVIDVGDGKGYLSSRLALEYKLKVLGIDANEKNTENAQKRNKKLQKAWNGLTKRAELIDQGLVPTKHGKSKTIKKINENTKDNGDHQNVMNDMSSNLRQLNFESNYKTINEFITIKSNLNDLIQKNFQSSCDLSNLNICLVGLHTCGNLSSTSLKVFSEQKSIKILCNIGCCYHLLKEEFNNTYNVDNMYENKEILSKNIDYGFPLSTYLRMKNIKLGRNARMLISQSINRICHEKDIKSTKSLFYRALLQVLINKFHPELKDQIQIGKMKKIDTFDDYLNKCEIKLNIKFTSDNINDDDDDHKNLLSNLEKEYEEDENYLKLFYLIRMSFAPLLETAILLDKLLYLKEMSFDKSFVVKLFDPVISPRCYGIIAIR